jgi:hypothetical protein
MSWSPEEAQQLIENVKRGKALREDKSLSVPSSPAIKPKMNGTETRYAHLLDLRQRVGEILNYQFEKVALVLTSPKPGIKAMRYTPDFKVVIPSELEIVNEHCTVEFHEVKGKHIREDAWLKFKMGIEQFPEFRFVLAQWIDGTWKIKRF